MQLAAMQREDDARDAQRAMFRAEFEAARSASAQAGARYRLAMMAEHPDFVAVAELARTAALAAQRVEGFARLLARL